jgi:PAS domain S-box-containing protein
MGKASPLYNRQGDVVGAIESIRDITDRKLFEDALRESERKYRSILENIQDVYYRTDPEGNLILASPSAAQLLGYDSVSEMIGINIAQSVYSNPEERSKFLAELNSRGFVTDYEVMIKKRDGTRIYVSTNSHKYFDLSGNFLGVEGIFRDITARKQAEEEILKKNEELAAASEELRTQFDALAESERSTRLSEKRLIMAQEIGHTGCWEYNLRTNEIWGSAEGLRIFGFPAIAGNFPINEIEACIPERERVHQALIDLISAGTDYNLEFTINPADGSASKMIHSIAKLENDAEGNPLRVVGVIQDITERKHADAAVRESTEIYRHFFRTSMDCVFITTKDGRWVDLNDAAVELFGYSNREELMKVRISDLYANPEDRKKHTDTIVEQGYTKEYPVDLRKKDGTVLHTLITSIARYDDDGAVTGFQGTIRDVSESRHTEQAVLESEERYRRITEAISDYIYTVRVENGRAVETRHGPGCVGVTGYTSEEFAADPYLWIRMVVEEDRPKVEDHVRHILLGEDVPAIEHRILRKDGTVHWVRNTPIRQLDADGRLVSYDGVIKDITVTKRAEDLTRTTLQQLSTLISRLNAGVIMVSEDGKVEQVNQALCDIYNLPDTPESLIGLTSQEMVNKILDAYVSPAEALARIRERTARGTHINGYEITLRNERTILVDYIPIIDADGKQRGRIWHHLDITGRKQAENALALASRKLNILSSITRHDILNQLTALSGFLQLYHEVCKGDAKVQEYFKRLMGIIKVIGDQISFTKFYQDLGVEAPVWLRVQDVARKAEVASGFSGVRFTIRTGDLEIFADPLLEKVFFNLFDNANRHGEQVTEIHVNSMFRDGECSIVVEDDGVGVPAADKERIFIRGVGKNTGLGLFLVREILSITGITIRETGVPGKGARFEIIVPAGACRSGKETSYRDQKQQGKRL